ncbi:PH domain-containing protein [Agromyces sp. SYSU K20354]|uniref:PH domain-containing protein n=1 Tax=Agromyces cavernae TaxID=2898659 RepID=UPI001E512741|nr:PH domain-containing protein [Agromyces cavernae]MCD2441573.1 PH domain-containing protein [Agromyces cavernae]
MSAPARPAAVTNLADGEWHRLHPASPLLRGGLVFIAVLGFVIANLRERAIDLFLVVFAPDAERFGGNGGQSGDEWANDPVGAIVMNGLVGWALLGLVVLIIAVIVGFWLSWRMHTFRVTPEAVEVRSGILFRSHRSARLDRIQGINVNRPLFARLFGTAKLEVSVAGQSANVQLSYLGSALADGLRADVLRLASGARAERAATQAAAVNAPGATSADPSTQPTEPAQSAGPTHRAEPAELPAAPSRSAAAGAPLTARAGGLVTHRVDEFLAPELDPDLAPPESVVHLPLGRVIGSTLLGGSTIWAIVLVAIIVVGVTSGQPWVLFSFVPAAIGLVSYMWSRITKSLRYSIAGTPDGVRIGHGLLSTGNQTIPPGRIHAIEATQWVFWRPFGWWSVRINVAGQSVSASNEAAQRTLVLPVGTAADVHRVLGLLLPDAAAEVAPFVSAGLTGRGEGGGYSSTPRRAAWLRPFSWRRIGWAAAAGVALIRSGALLRSLTLVPLARMQSVAVSVGPVDRALDLAGIRLHTVTGPVNAMLPVVDRSEAMRLFERLSEEAVERAASDTTHHWGVAARADETTGAAEAGHAADTAPAAPEAPNRERPTDEPPEGPVR